MSQNWTNDCFAAGHVAQTDLTNMENNFLALHSCFSGAVQPAGAVEGQLWRDTAKKVLKQYNGASWFGMFHGDATQKILVYDDTVLEGYLRDSGVTDKVIALKGGATYVTAGVTAGSWTIGGLTSANESAHSHNHTHTGPSHTHQWYDYNAGGTDTSWQSIGTVIQIATGGTNMGIAAAAEATVTGDYYTNASGTGATGADATAGSAHNHTVSHDGTARPFAAVVILEYLDL